MEIDTSHILTDDGATRAFDALQSLTRYDGMRIKGNDGPEIYLVMWGRKYWIPNLPTFNKVFANSDGIVVDDALILHLPRGGELSDGSLIAQADDGNPAQYLVSMGQKFAIPSIDVLRKFNFGAAVTVPALLLRSVLTGPVVS